MWTRERKSAPVGLAQAGLLEGVPPWKLEEERDLAEAAEEVGGPFELVRRHREAEVGVAAEEDLEGDLALDSRQRRAEADVDALAEGDVPVGVGPHDVVVLRI